jgi:hypothetical protein
MKKNNDLGEQLSQFEGPEAPHDFFDKMDRLIEDEPLPQRGNLRPFVNGHKRLALASSSVAAAAVVAIIAVGLGSDEKDPSPIAQPPSTEVTQVPTTELRALLARDVAEKGVTAFGTVQGVSATVDEKIADQFTVTKGKEPQYSTRTLTLRLKANGDYWESVSTGYVSSYDAAKGVRVECMSSSECVRYSGVVADDPGSRPQAAYVSLLNRLRVAAADPSSALTEVSFQGRDAWRLDVKTTADQAFAVGLPTPTTPVSLSVIVDKQTAFPLYGSTTVDGVLSSETTIRDLVVDPQFGPGDFDAARGKTVRNVDENPFYSRVTLEQTQVRVGYQPLVPKSLPAGFALAEVSVGRNNRYAESPGGMAENRFLQNEVVMTFRRGLESFTVTTRSAGKNLPWTDPEEMFLEVASAPNVTDVPLTAGSFAGSNAHLVERLDSVHIWGVGTSLVFTITGDISSDDMLDVVQSL